MRIGYMVPEFPGQTHIMFWREVRALRDMGERVFLVSTRYPSSSCPHDFCSDAISETHYIYPPTLGCLVSWTASGGKGLASCLSYLRSLEARQLGERMKQGALLMSAIELTCWAHEHRINHIHGHSCADAAHVLALARRLGGPAYSMTLHGDLAVYGRDHRAKMKDAAFVCAVGRHLRRQLEDQIGIPAHKIIETFMGIETSEARKSGTARLSAQGKLHLVTVARLNAAKGHEYVLMAINQGVKMGLDLRYTIVGDGPHLAALVNQTRELCIEEHVIFAGSLAESAVYKMLSSADVFILASTGLGEAWPVSVMEAMSAGLPVICSTIGATSEMITCGEDGFLVPQADAGALIMKIALLAQNVELRKRLGEAAQATARQRFDVGLSAGALRDAVRASRASENRCRFEMFNK